VEKEIAGKKEAERKIAEEKARQAGKGWRI